tara:strand:- start:1017 stop:1259 length:243 start_codon:yes stop_codon:yes gene_type:complete
MEIKTITRKWGNSIAVVIPRNIVDKQRIREDQEITITIERKRPKAGELFGKFPRRSTKTAQELKNEAREGWESDSDKERN